jgi:hypothetical protein
MFFNSIVDYSAHVLNFVYYFLYLLLLQLQLADLVVLRPVLVDVLDQAIDLWTAIFQLVLLACFHHLKEVLHSPLI